MLGWLDEVQPSVRYGYVRVRRTSQKRTEQLAALAAAACSAWVEDVASAPQQRLPKLGSLLRRLTAGDVVTVSRLDTLPTGYRRLLKIIAQIEARGASFELLAGDWPRTEGDHARPGVAQLQFAIDTEKRQVGQRLSAGRTRARLSGGQLGRRPKLTIEQRGEALARRAAGETIADIASHFGVSRTLVSAMAPQPAVARRAPSEEGHRNPSAPPSSR